MKTSECLVRVRYDEIGLYSMAHHSNVSKWFDVALSQLLRENGKSIKWFEEKGIFFPVFESHSKFIMPIHFDDEILIRTNVLSFTSVNVKFGYQFFRDEVLVASGSTSHIFVNQSLRPINIRKVCPEAYESFSSYVQK